jgi:drug/metabolite transporter (DMT)-like permease
MTSVVAFLVLASAALHASWNALVKGRSGDPLAASVGLSLGWLVLGAPWLLVVPLPAAVAVGPLVGSIAVHLVYFSLLVAAYRAGDLSFVYTLARGVPPMLVAGGAWVVVGERPSVLGLAGIVAIGAGVLALYHHAGDARSGAEAVPRRRRTTLLALATAACIAVYTLIDGVGSRASGNAISYWLWLTVGQGLCFSVGGLAVGGRNVAREALVRWRTAVVAAVLSAAGYGVALWAMTQAPIALVAALRETSVLFAAILGAIALREPFGPRRIAAAALVAAGAVCVRFG